MKKTSTSTKQADKKLRVDPKKLREVSTDLLTMSAGLDGKCPPESAA